MKISNEGGQGELTHEEREVAAGEERDEPGGRRTYAAVTRAAAKPTVPTVPKGVTTRSKARKNGGLEEVSL